MYPFFRLICRIIVKLIGEPELIGGEHIPREGPFVLAANHQSILDPLVLIACIPRKITFLAAAYIFRIPLVGLLIRAAGALPGHGEGSMKSINTGLARLSQGEVLGLFPEGGVSLDGAIKPFRSGGPILPKDRGPGPTGSPDRQPGGIAGRAVYPRRGQIRITIGSRCRSKGKGAPGGVDRLNRELVTAIGRLV